MRTKRFIYATTALLVLSGCMTTEARLSSVDLNTFKVDCSIKDRQLAMLETQKLSVADRQKNAFLTGSISGFVSTKMDGTYDERMRISKGSYDSAYNTLIRDIHSWCP